MEKLLSNLLRIKYHTEWVSYGEIKAGIGILILAKRKK
ncbi:hypothetical protein ADICYQ_3651 [Cyclobacterium qasimii M12-11B]|uniref:Uncharacterized protein n=1 Tax=Cyclobacterium qasimii M12-11B TaxID=641524 RepID=S7WTE7_9BACT|nr:hypothetical protein ADICYQ_3651 [Cyclobacterium qasimii M12-11B]